MKKIISSILAVLMLVSLCAAFNVAAEEPTHELKAVVMMKENNAFRFVFSMTKDELKTLGADVDNISSYGYEIQWALTDKAEHTTYGDFKEGFAHGANWAFDDNGNLYYEVTHNEYSTADFYAKAGKGELWGVMRNFQTAEQAAERGKEIDKVLYDANCWPAHPDLKVNTIIDGNGACVLTVTTEDVYYAEAPVDSGESGETGKTDPPQTADFSAAIVAVAVLALGATVVVAKKKH